MMGIIIIHICTIEDAFMLHTAAGATEGRQTCGNSLTGDTQEPGSGGNAQSIQGIVAAQDSHIQMAIDITVTDDIEMLPVRAHIGSVDAVVLTQTEGDIVDAIHGFDGMDIVTVGDDTGSGHGSELIEGLLDIGQVLEIVQVIGFHIQDHRYGGEEIQEGIAVLTALQDDGITATHPMTRTEQGQVAADHDRGIQFSLHEDMGHHRSSRGLSVGTGDADRVLVGLHDLAPGLSPLKDGDACRTCCGDLRIVIVGCGGADDALGALDILTAVTDLDRDALADQLVGRDRGIHIRTGDLHAHALQHQAQGTHGDTANTDQMHPAAGSDIVADLLLFHISKILQTGYIRIA